ncbi:HdeD family acid-resistance protein [Brucella anthropi]|uniref:HdeD family acid-resistance protein n=1 Tax=Brucella TaxID=234 RepID=UPI00124C5556|nr:MULTISPECIES: HdeD family acid-resistance protein [Brucella]KAB2716360.1 HdeD family acid-resistance protein [Brucella intermedia]KAB2775686.1 HdeD family acid-resistance protein [Brucella anthropi]
MTSIPSTDSPKTEAMNDILANNWWAVALRGVVAILFGIAAFAMPLVTMLSLVVVFAAFSFVDGVFGIIMSVRGARKGERWVWLLLSGILGIVASAVAILWPGITVLAFVILVAAWALVSGTLMLISAFRLKIDHGRVWLVIGGIASIVFGILLVISPFIGALVLTFWTGAHALVLGATLLILAYKLRSHRTGQPSNLAAAGTA